MTVNKSKLTDASIVELTALLNAGLMMTPEVRAAVSRLNCAVARAERREREEQGMAR